MQKVNTSLTSMFNEATFREIILPSSGNVKDYVAYSKEICGPVRKQ